jgi:hypothetical protein
VDPRFFWALRHLEAESHPEVRTLLSERAPAWMGALQDATARSGLAFAIRAGVAPGGAAEALAGVLERAPAAEWAVLLSEARVPVARRFELGLRRPEGLPRLAPLLRDAERAALRRFIEAYVGRCEAVPERIEDAKAGPRRVRPGVAPHALAPLLEPAGADEALRRRVAAVLPRPA